MIGRIVGMLVGRKLKEKAVDVVLDKVNLPDPVENVFKIAATGNVGDLIGGIPINVAPEEALGEITKKVPIKRPKK
jgi:hypothetical protein